MYIVLLYKEGDDWVFGKGRHAGEDLISVAGDDPEYLEWLLDQDWLGDEWREAIEAALI